MKRRTSLRPLVLIMALVLALLAAGCGGTGENAGGNAPAEQPPVEDLSENAADGAVCAIPQEKTMFTEIDTVDLDGETVDRSFFKDHMMTVVNVWSVDCAPCIEELPALQEISEEFAGRDVAVVGLLYELGPGLSDRAREEAEEILADAGVTYRQLITSEAMADSEELQSLTGYPTTFFVDAYGRIVDTFVGAQNYRSWEGRVKLALRSVEGG